MGTDSITTSLTFLCFYSSFSITRPFQFPVGLIEEKRVIKASPSPRNPSSLPFFIENFFVPPPAFYAASMLNATAAAEHPHHSLIEVVR
jgi:hypothetical protein